MIAKASREAALEISPGRQPWVSNHPEAQALEGRQGDLPPFQGWIIRDSLTQG